MSDSLWPYGQQHARTPCPSPTTRAYSNSCPLSWWCYPTILSTVIPFCSCLHISQHQGLFKQFSSSHQVAKVLEFQLQHQSTQWMRNAGLDEAQAVIKIAGRNINNLRYTDDSTLQKKTKKDWFPLGWTSFFTYRSDRQSVWWTMDRGLWHCSGDRDQDHPQEKGIKKKKGSLRRPYK